MKREAQVRKIVVKFNQIQHKRQGEVQDSDRRQSLNPHYCVLVLKLNLSIQTRRFRTFQKYSLTMLRLGNKSHVFSNENIVVWM